MGTGQEGKENKVQEVDLQAGRNTQGVGHTGQGWWQEGVGQGRVSNCNIARGQVGQAVRITRVTGARHE